MSRKLLVIFTALAVSTAAPSFAADSAPTPAAMTVDLNTLPAYKPDIQVAGGVRIFGSWMKGVMAKLAAGFKKFHPDAEMATNFMTSSEGAIAGLYTGISDVAPAGDDAKITDMMPFYDTFHYVPTEISIATGGFEARGTLWPAVIVVNKDNPLAHLSMDQLARIFGAERTGAWEVGPEASNGLRFTAKYARDASSNIRNWGELGLKGDYANKPIQTYGYSAPGFKIYMERRLFHWSQKWNENYKEYVEEQEATKDDAGHAVASERMLEALSKDKYGIGWAAWLHAKNYPNVKVLPIASKDGGPYVAYTPENVANRSYPLTRDYYIYVNKPLGRPLDPKVREFLRFILSREGQQIIAEDGQYSPLPADFLEEQRKKLD